MNNSTQIYCSELGGIVMSYWGRIVGNIYGTIIDMYLLEDGRIQIITNHNEYPTHYLSKELSNRLIEGSK